MAIDSVWGATHMERNEIFNTQLKEVFLDQLFASQWVNFIGDFMDGDNYKINSVGELTIDQKSEATSLPVRRPDSGQFLFNINEYVGVKTAFTDVFFEDDFMAPQVLSTTVDRMMRAFEEYLETRVLRLQREQTDDDENAINGVAHRFTANGTIRDLTIQDFAFARYSLEKANVPLSNQVCLIDPSQEFNANVFSQVTSSDNPKWEGILESGFINGTGIRFVKNIYGFDVYVSNYLDSEAAVEGALDDYQGNVTATVVGDKASLFFSALDPMSLPFIGAWRRRPVVKSWRDEDKETEFHEMSSRFGLALFRPENLVVCMTGTGLN